RIPFSCFFVFLLAFVFLLVLSTTPAQAQAAPEPTVFKKLDQAIALFDSSEHELAYSLFQQYFPKYEVSWAGKDVDRDVRYYRGYFRNLFQLGKYLEALEVVDPMMMHIKRQHPELDSNYVKVQIFVSECYVGLDNFTQALEELKVLDPLLEDPEKMPAAVRSSVLRNKCECYLELDRTSDAIVACNEAIEILEHVDGYLKERVRTYVVLSRIYQNTGQYQRSIQLTKRAVDWFEREAPNDYVDLSQFYNALGVNYFYTQQYDYAITHFNEAIRLREIIFGPDHINIAGLYNNIGVCYMKIGDFAKAEENYQHALDIRWKTNDGKETVGIASTIFNIGMSYFDRDDYEGAIPHLERARRIRLQELGPEHSGVAHCDLVLGSSYFNMEQPEKAIGYLTRSAQVFEKARGITYPETSRAFRGLAGSYAMAGQCDSARYYFGQFYKSVGYDPADPYDFDKTSIVLLLSDGLSIELEALRDYCPEGERQIDSIITHSLQLIDYARSTFKEIGSEKAFFARALKVYDKILVTYSMLLEKTHDPAIVARAFEIVEKEKSTYLLKASSIAQSRQLVGIPDTIFNQEEGIKKTLTEIENEQYLEKQKGEAADIAKLDSLEKEFFVEKRNYRDLLDVIEQDYPNYYQMRFETQVAQLEQVQQKLLREGQVLVQYMVGYSMVHLLRVERDSATLVSIPKDFPLDEWIEGFRNALIAKEQGLAEYLRLGYLLYEKLIAPAQLKPGQELLVVPDGILGYLPFELLLTEEVSADAVESYKALPYLFKQHPMHYSFSATITMRHQEQQRKRGWHGVLTFVPEFDGGPVADASMRGGDTLRSQLQPLAGALREAEMIERLLGGKIIKDREATERAFVEQAGRYSVLHLATHAIANNENPAFSKLYFSQVADTAYDGTLLASELYNMRLNADLVTLSACNTGFGKLEQAEGIVSLGRAFAYAGSPNLVASLWPVEDQATARLME
ncbi:MAG: CHAT domain-containing protein, partial [Phaeodactylibacter sp.]|nr:CHAT domain-containing protein [Phaeodactylibacter sp.]